MSYRLRLFLSLLAVLVVPIGVTFLFGRFWTQRAVTHETRVRLEEALAGLTEDIVRREDDLIKKASALSGDPALIEAVARRNRTAAIAILEKTIAVGGFTLTEVGDARGIVLARGHNPTDWGEDKSAQTIITTALAGRTAADIEGGHSGIAIRGVAPLHRPGMTNAAGARPIGTVMVGEAINEEFLATYSRVTGVDLAILDTASLVAASSPDFAVFFAEAMIDPDGPVFPRHLLEKRELLAVPLHRNDGILFGWIVAGRDRAASEGFLAAAGRALRIGLAVGLVLALLLALGLVRSFSRPLDELRRAMRTAEQDGVIRPIPVTRQDEFGELERRFNEMADRLAEAQRAIEALQRDRVRTAQKSAIERIVAEMAHEIRNPLTAMAAQVELLRGAPTDEARVGARVEILTTEIRRLDRAIADLVAATRPPALSRARIDLGRRLGMLLDLLEPSTGEKRIAFERAFAAGVLFIDVDEEKIHQAILNVLINAIESIEAEGRITVTAMRAGARMRISVQDTGRGMTAEETDRVFDAWYSTKERGTGLGLAIALRIIEAHGGRIGIESVPGRGTRVDILLPIGENPDR
jgi:signal transduction histidine kinase